METINKITTSKQTTMYDHLCKMIIGNEEVLSRIIKAAVDEANHLNVEEIRRLIKGVHIGDLIVNPHFHLVDKKGFIKDEGMVYYDILCYIDVPQEDGKNIRVYLNVEIQNNPYPGYSIITRGYAYISRIVSEQWGSEYDDKLWWDEKGLFIMNHAKGTKKKRWAYECLWNKWKDYLWNDSRRKRNLWQGSNSCDILKQRTWWIVDTIHGLNKKYEEHDELLTPLMVLLNNVLDYKGKQRIIEEYGLNTKKIESEVKDMCDLGESIVLEARNEGKQIERKEKNIAHVKK